jgi:hypothetical protein
MYLDANGSRADDLANYYLTTMLRTYKSYKSMYTPREIRDCKLVKHKARQRPACPKCGKSEKDRGYLSLFIVGRITVMSSSVSWSDIVRFCLDAGLLCRARLLLPAIVSISTITTIKINSAIHQ